MPDPGPEGHSWNQFVLRIPACPNGANACDDAHSTTCIACPTSEMHGLPEGRCRNWLQSQLQQRGVNTIIYYPIPIHRQPAYVELGYGPGSLPVTERLASEVLSLPIFPELNNAQLQQILEALGVEFK